MCLGRQRGKSLLDIQADAFLLCAFNDQNPTEQAYALNWSLVILCLIGLITGLSKWTNWLKPESLCFDGSTTNCLCLAAEQ